MLERKCSKCKKTKPETEFYKRRKSGAIFSRCKTCVAAASKSWRTENPVAARQHYKNANVKRDRSWYVVNAERYREGIRKALRKVRYEALCHYGGNPPSCACCGESGLEFLTLDHKHGDGSTHRKQISITPGGSSIFYWLRNNHYPCGFQVLCYNCNCAKRTGDCCPHQHKTLTWFYEI